VLFPVKTHFTVFPLDWFSANRHPQQRSIPLSNGTVITLPALNRSGLSGPLQWKVYCNIEEGPPGPPLPPEGSESLQNLGNALSYMPGADFLVLLLTNGFLQ